MTLMVIAVLILVSSGIVLAISLANSHSIAAQAEETLAVLTENAGAGENRMQRPDGSMDPRGGRMNRDRRGFRGEPPEIRSGRDAAAAGPVTVTDTPALREHSYGTVTPAASRPFLTCSGSSFSPGSAMP